MKTFSDPQKQNPRGTFQGEEKSCQEVRKGRGTGNEAMAEREWVLSVCDGKTHVCGWKHVSK